MERGEGADDKEINNVFRQFYVAMYSSEGNSDSLKDSCYLKNLVVPSITNRQYDLLESPFSFDRS